MRYGYFDDDHREYVITRPDTPLPWINYLGTGCLLRHHLEHGRRLLLLPGCPAAPDHAVPLQQRARPTAGGRYLYLRDNGTGDYWSPSWQPTATRP